MGRCDKCRTAATILWEARTGAKSRFPLSSSRQHPSGYQARPAAVSSRTRDGFFPGATQGCAYRVQPRARASPLGPVLGASTHPKPRDSDHGWQLTDDDKEADAKALYAYGLDYAAAAGRGSAAA